MSWHKSTPPFYSLSSNHCRHNSQVCYFVWKTSKPGFNMLGNGEVSPALNHSHGQLLSVQTLQYLLGKKKELLSSTLTCTHFFLLPTSLLCVSFCFLISFYSQLLFFFFISVSFTSYPTFTMSVFSAFFSLPISSHNIPTLLNWSALQNFIVSEYNCGTQPAVI